MADIVLKDRNGNGINYPEITSIKVNTVSGETAEFVDSATIPESMENIPIALDFSDGDQTITAPDGTVVKSAIIQKPENLLPENVAEGVDIAGIVGTLTVPESLENIPVALDFSDGDQTIIAPDGTVVKSAIIEKPNTLIPGNIAEGVDIAGITGTLTVPESLENIPIALDFSEGDQTIIAPDGMVVKSAIIQKPENLLPENVAEGVDIAGIIGTLAAGGSGKVSFGILNGSTTNTVQTVDHNLGAVPDIILVLPMYLAGANGNWLQCIQVSNSFKAATGLLYNSYWFGIQNKSYGYYKMNTANVEFTGENTTYIHGVTETTFNVPANMLYTGINYVWVAVGGLT